MAVDDLPLAVLATVEVGRPKGVLGRGTVHGRCGVLVADGVGQIATDAGADQLEAIGGAVGEP
jgi:hypothetical protein